MPYKFKVGDMVRIKKSAVEDLCEYEFDWLQDVQAEELSYTNLDRMLTVLKTRQPMKVVMLPDSPDGWYEVRPVADLDRTVCFEEHELVKCK